MPELPDIELYLHALRPRLVGRPLDLVRLGSPFLVRSVDPPLTAVHGRRVLSVTRLGKRVVWSLEGDLFVIIHLMIAGRFKWSDRGAKMPGKIGLAAFDFDGGTLLLTEAGTQRRASLHVVRGAHELAAHDPGGIDVLTSTVEDFRAALTRENHTLKRALTGSAPPERDRQRLFRRDPALSALVADAIDRQALRRASDRVACCSSEGSRIVA